MCLKAQGPQRRRKKGGHPFRDGKETSVFGDGRELGPEAANAHCMCALVVLGLGERGEGLALAPRVTSRLPQVLIVQGMFIELSEGNFPGLETGKQALF